MGWHLPPGVAFCEVGGDPIFFDLQADRYVSLAEGDRAVFQAMREGREVHPGEAARLTSAGLVVAAAGECKLHPVSVAVPQDDLGPFGDHHPSIGGIARVATSLVWAKRAARRNRIAQTIVALEGRKRELAGAFEPAVVVASALGFAACRPLVPIARRCLIDSLALMDFLLARGQATTLVFGVRTDPFAAHCWVQTEHHILTCAADDALGFTPVMVL